MDLTGRGRVVVTRLTWRRSPSNDAQLFVLIPTVSAAPVPASMIEEVRGNVSFNVLFPQGLTITPGSELEIVEGLEVIGSGQVAT